MTHGSRHRKAFFPATGATGVRLRNALLVVAYLMAVLASSQLGRVVHLALERHVPCQHGHWVHAPELERADARSDDGSGRTVASPEPQLRHDGIAADKHVHCDAVAVEQSPLPTTPDGIAVRLLAWEMVPSVSTGLAAPRGMPLWLLAPKQSPPTV